jgi:hypothetical protein
MFKLDEQRIQEALFGYLYGKGNEIVLPNISWSYLRWEADTIGITKAGYLYEYEIKTTYSDFLNDFKKRKHHALKRGERVGSPNYFIFVAPMNAVPLCLPDYAGLIEISQNGSRLFVEEIKRPKMIHRNKLTPKDKIAMLRVIMFRYWKMSSQLTKYKVQRELFN